MRDEVLPWPVPDWDNPLPIDPSTLTPEQIEVVARLEKLASMLPQWLAAAITIGAAPADWQQLATELASSSTACAEQARPAALELHYVPRD